MKEINYWQQFLNTGKVEDYLSYKHQEVAEQSVQKGDHPHAGTGQCYRNDFKSGAFRGI